ncbi:hypothetical protein BV20DRAFT_698613 [Pilatotrama ljubarskyi]|nr:hypothetical protein BV20DRAFT_698613 [Pilatotrama ljubarskyi]
MSLLLYTSTTSTCPLARTRPGRPCPFQQRHLNTYPSHRVARPMQFWKRVPRPDRVVLIVGKTRDCGEVASPCSYGPSVASAPS